MKGFVIPLLKKSIKSDENHNEAHSKNSNDSASDHQHNFQRRESSLGACNHGSFKIVVLGDKAVGKTTLCRQFSGYDSEVTEDGKEVYDTGIFVNVDKIKRQYDLEIFDIHINICKQNQSWYKNTLLSADGVLLVYSKDNKESFIKLLEIITDVRYSTKQSIPLIVVGNKSDLHKTVTEVSQKDIHILHHTRHTSICSNKKEDVTKLFQTLVHDCISDKESKQGELRKNSAPPFVTNTLTQSSNVEKKKLAQTKSYS